MKKTLLRIYTGEGYSYKGVPLSRAVLEFYKKEGVSGATVWRGLESYGPKSGVHSVDILRLSTDLPLVIDAILEIEKAKALIPKLKEMVDSGVILTIDVDVW